MALRKVESVVNVREGREARVYRDSEWQEWRVRHYLAGLLQPDADYHCDDKVEAQQYARTWVWQTRFTSAQHPDATRLDEAHANAEHFADEYRLPLTVYRDAESSGWGYTNPFADRLRVAELHSTVLPRNYFD